VIAIHLLALAADPVSLGIEADRKEYFLGEGVPVRIRIEIDGKFLRENAVPLTLRKTDVPVLLEAPWLKGLAASEGDATLAVNDDVVAARRTGDANSTVLVIERTLRPKTAGDLELAAPVIRFASATRFDEDALGTRVALDRTESSVKGAPLVIRILPLPTEGRPARFSGGVGQFTITASADATEVEVGKSLNLVVVVKGSGDLADLVPPRLDELADFHIIGRLHKGRPDRALQYEISPLSAEVTEIPPISFHYFDPAPPAGYRVARTAAIPLRVRPGVGGNVPVEPGRVRCFTGVVEGLVLLVAAVVVGAILAVKALLRRRRNS
jgi:hypothetical protein